MQGLRLSLFFAPWGSFPCPPSGGGAVYLHVKLQRAGLNTSWGEDGVRPEECVKLDQGKSTQRTRICNVNWFLVPLLSSRKKNILEL